MIELGRFEIDPDRRTLRRDGELVRVGSRAFDILAAIVSAGGHLVGKDELMNAAWPETIVEENNIHVHISALRKIFGADHNLILTVPGRGYQLAKQQSSADMDKRGVQAIGANRLPRSRKPLIGRDREIGQILEMLGQTYVLTLVGAGGIGKTRLAIEAARQLETTLPEPVWFVELAASTTKDDVLSAIAKGCDVRLGEREINPAGVTSALAGKRGLLLLDNAEHVIDYVAQAVESLNGKNDSLRILVTSREPMRILPETLLRVDALDVPPPGSTSSEILARSAVHLFLSRTNSLQREIGTDSGNIRLVGEICRRLDGIPLAIELAATRADALGVEGVYRRLDDRMALLAGGYRTALPRHQTLRATFDWSYALLDAGARMLFRRLAIFDRAFTCEAMCEVAGGDDLTIGDIIGKISELVAKSLVTVEFNGPDVKYRLLESTRAYGLEKLDAEGEQRHIAARHVRYLESGFLAHSGLNHLNQLEHAAELHQTFDDRRSAFDLAFSNQGDPRPEAELPARVKKGQNFRQTAQLEARAPHERPLVARGME